MGVGSGIASDEVEGLLGNPALFAVGNGYFAPFVETAVEDFDLTSLVQDKEVVAVVGRCALDCDGRRGNDAACVNLLEVLLLQGTNIGKNGDEQKQNCR